jgi:hypothetical protein
MVHSRSCRSAADERRLGGDHLPNAITGNLTGSNPGARDTRGGIHSHHGHRRSSRPLLDRVDVPIQAVWRLPGEKVALIL